VGSVTGISTSSNAIASKLKERCSIELSDRSIRVHIAKLGLNNIRKSLPELLNTLKKTKKNRQKKY
jgi:hypothetical protein